jgi:acyl-CoA synthetase (AMP-forming)/AMP-acid ligase II
MPDPIMGEEVKAFIVLAANTTASEQEIIDFCRQHLSKDKCPNYANLVRNIKTFNLPVRNNTLEACNIYYDSEDIRAKKML